MYKPFSQAAMQVFHNTQIPIKRLFDYIKAGQSLDIFLNDFPVVRRSEALAVLWSDPTDYCL